MAELSEHDRGLLKGIMDTFGPAIVALEKQVTALSARVLELESSGVKYLGVHQASIAYRKGHMVTYDGSIWCATRDVSVEKPGHGDGWQLACKSGRDAASPRPDASAASHPRNGSGGVPANPRFK
jgi:hypothetical protein